MKALTCIQESLFVLDHQSGYFQLDVDPADMAGGEWADSGQGFWKYCMFLRHVSREETIRGDAAKSGIPLTDPAYRPDLTAFCCSAVLKGYFDAGTWVTLTKNDYYAITHEKMKRLLVNYAMNSDNHRTLSIGVPGEPTQNYTYPASQILLRILAWSYNRGRYTDTQTWGDPAWTFHLKPFFKNHNNGQTALEDLIHYVPENETQKEWPYPWGARYIYQIPAIASELERYARNPQTRYSAGISLDDMNNYLDILKPLFPSDILAAGKKTAHNLFGEKKLAYDSEEFFNIFHAIAGSMIEASEHHYLRALQ